MNRPALIIALALLGAAPAATAQTQTFCNGVLGLVAGYIGCPPTLEEVGGAELGVICVGDASVAAPRPTPEALETQVRGCLPSGWTMAETVTGTVGNRPARYREYIRTSDRLRLRVGELIVRRDTTPRSARATIVELKQAFIAVPLQR